MYEVLLIVFALCLSIHTYTDLKEQLLYDEVSTLLMVTGVIYAYYFGTMWEAVQGAMASVVIMLVI